MKKIAVLFFIISCFFVLPATAEEIEVDRLMAAGICGGMVDESYGGYTNSVTWQLYESGRCVIEGSGRIYNRDEIYNVSCSVCGDSWEHYSFWCGHYVSGYEDDGLMDKDGVTDFSNKIKTIEFSGSITSIGYGAFQYLESLEEITLPPNIETVEMMLFWGCSSLKSVSLPENVRTIEYSSFEGCTSLTEIIIPDDVTVIEGSAFSGCASLKTVTIPEGVTVIEDNVFSNCIALEKILIPKNVSQISSSAFLGCISIEIKIAEDNSYFTVENGIVLNKDKTHIIYVPSSTSGTFTIPEGVTVISEKLFCGNEKITEIIIPDTVTKIGESAFSGCTSLSKIDLPDTITEILSHAFSGCISLKEITIPQNVTALRSTFYGCTSLEKVTLPNSIKTLDSVFENCTALSTITLPEGLVSMTDAFQGCILLKEIVIPKSVIYFDYAFYGCSGLENVEISEGITLIGDSAFWGCTSLNNVEIPNSITEIRYAAFSNCTSLSNIEIPYSVTTICEYAFAHCTSLEKITLPSDVITLEAYTFYDCMALKEAVLPQKLQVIEEGAFGDCTALAEISFPDTLEEISYFAFENVPLFYPQNITEDYYVSGWLVKLFNDGCEEYKISGNEKIFPGAFSESGITRVYFDDEIKEIKPNIFRCNTELSYVEIPASVTKIGQHAFSGCTSLEKVKFSSGHVFSDLTGEPEEILPRLEEIGERAFSGCSMLYDIEFPEELKIIGDGAFFGCSNLKNLYISEKMRYIGCEAFMGCSGLENVVIIPQLQYSYDENGTGLYAYSGFGYEWGADNYIDTLYLGCEYYDEYVLAQSGLKAGKTYCLYGCDYDIEEKILEGTESGVKRCQSNGENFLNNVYAIKIKEGTISIGDSDSSYGWFVNLREFMLPDSLEYIGENAFSGLYNISVTIPQNVSYISPLCGWNEYIYIDVVPENEHYSSIGEEVYSKDGTVLYKAYWTNGTYTVSNKVTHIYDFALNGCGEIIIHKNLKKIGSYNFDGQSNIYYEGSPEEWSNVEILEKPAYSVHFFYGKKMPKTTIERYYTSNSRWNYKLTVLFPDIEINGGEIVFVCGTDEDGKLNISSKRLSAEKTFAEFNLTDVENIRVFIWENFDTLKPLAAVEEIYIYK